MKKSQRLQRIANLSVTAEQVAAQAFSRARDEAERYATQIRDLERYRDDYLRQFARENTDGLDGYRAQKLRAFVVRIEEALHMLLDRHAQAERRREQERANWMDRRRRTGTMNEVVTRARGTEDKQAEKALQREMDDRPRASSARRDQDQGR